MAGLFDKPRVHTSAEGFFRAAENIWTLLSPKAQEAIAEFRRLNSDAAKLAFADQLCGYLGNAFEDAWPVIYECARLVRENHYYKQPRKSRPAYDTFEQWWVHFMGRAVEQFQELEATYEFSKTAGLLSESFSKATKAKAEHVRNTIAAAEPTKPQEIGKGKAGPGRPTKDKTVAQINRLSESKGGTRAEYLAGRIKALAASDQRAAEVVAKVERGEYASMRAAARDAGIIKPVDVVASAARAIAKVPVARLGELASRLSEDVRKALGA